MKKRSSRPLLRTAQLTAGSLLIGCGSGVGGRTPMPGNPKGSHYNEPVLVSGIVTCDHTNHPPDAVVFVSIRPLSGGPPLAAKKMPPGPFPMAFSLTEADRLPMGGADAIPEQFVLSVRLDSDGDASTRSADEPTYTTQVTSGAHTELMVPLAVEEPELVPLPGNPKGSHYDDIHSPQPPMDEP